MHVVVEMLMEFDEDIYHDLALSFRDELLKMANANNCHIWEHHVTTLIQEPLKGATLVSTLRPMPVMYRRYFRCLGLVC